MRFLERFDGFFIGFHWFSIEFLTVFLAFSRISACRGPWIEDRTPLGAMNPLSRALERIG